MSRSFTQYCPVCNKSVVSTQSYDKALDILKNHVREEHPNYDQEWYETYPEAYGN